MDSFLPWYWANNFTACSACGAELEISLMTSCSSRSATVSARKTAGSTLRAHHRPAVGKVMAREGGGGWGCK